MVLEQRRRLDIDRQNERWEGEWHFVNPPKRWTGTGGSSCTARREGVYQPVENGRSTGLDVTFSTVDGPKLRID